MSFLLVHRAETGSNRQPDDIPTCHRAEV